MPEQPLNSACGTLEPCAKPDAPSQSSQEGQYSHAALLERITAPYGVRPEVEFVQIAALVENVRA